ncbi:MAG: hypothetical protein QOJ65_446 [Fimbriimonadaceae bacterium]|jgi:hypothetical protein|nr:hypothetical protein [Fimbriimonadaceae bacterium]
MAQTVVGLFDDRDHAQKAVKDFLEHDFPADRISIITTDARGEFVSQKIENNGATMASEGALTGAVSGAVVGGIFGLLVGAGVLLIPGVGILAAGPVAATLAGAGIGALGGGLLGALVGLGIPKDQADTYAEAIRRGSVLVAVEVSEADIMRANEIMKKNGAVDVHQRASYYQQQGFTKYDPAAKPYSEEEAALEREKLRNYYGASNAGMSGQTAVATGGSSVHYDETVGKSSYEQQPAGQNMTYQQWEPAYRYGWQAAQNSSTSNFSDNESSLQRQWEQTNPGTYTLYRQAIIAGFNDACARTSGPKMI